MQDNEFDQLFRDKFQDTEIQPSGNVWSNIEKQLKPEQRRIFPVYWMAAAVVILALLVGLLMPRTERIKLQGSEMAVTASPGTSDVVNPTPHQKFTSPVEQRYKSTPLVIAPRLSEADVKKDFAALQPKAADPRLVDKKPEIVESIVSQTVKEPVIPEVDIVIASVDVPVDIYPIAEADGSERRSIKNVGDLVNFVVDKVDKREKKFIKFNTDEDDNSSLVAINIGILKFNRKTDK